MRIRLALHLTFWPIVLFVCFITAGQLGLYCETIHNSLLMSCGVFSISFSAMIAGAAQLYHYLT
jgi:hypothetical protein